MDLTPVTRDAILTSAASVAAARTPAAPRATAGAAPATATAPASLWDALTAEERAFFLRTADLGPLTYAPGAAPDAGEPAPRGQRIDLRA